jgi:hypothetical protein
LQELTDGFLELHNLYGHTGKVSRLLIIVQSEKHLNKIVIKVKIQALFSIYFLKEIYSRVIILSLCMCKKVKNELSSSI